MEKTIRDIYGIAHTIRARIGDYYWFDDYGNEFYYDTLEGHWKETKRKKSLHESIFGFRLF